MRKGFTIIEVILIIGVLSILIGGALSFSNNTLISANFNTTIAQIKQTILSAQNRALETYKDTNSGVYFAAGSYTQFSSTTYSGSDPDNEVFTLPSSIQLTNISFNSNPDILFTKYTGIPLNAGSFDVISDKGDSATIAVDSNGIISVTYN